MEDFFSFLSFDTTDFILLLAACLSIGHLECISAAWSQKLYILLALFHVLVLLLARESFSLINNSVPECEMLRRQ